MRENRAKMLQQRSLTGEQAATAKALALERTKEFELARDGLEKLLLCALDRNATPDWEARKDRTQFTESKPLRPTPDTPPLQPDALADRFNPVPLLPTLSFLDKFLNRRKLEKIAATDRSNAEAASLAAQKLDAEKVIWRAAIAQHMQVASTLESLHREDVRAWETRKENHRVTLKEKYALVDAEKSKYLSGDLDSLDTYIDDILSRSEYPDAFPKEHQFEYVAKTQTLVLDYELPNQTALPSVKGNQVCCQPP